jgi:ParB-like chromosome segregation protein Spo0J
MSAQTQTLKVEYVGMKQLKPYKGNPRKIQAKGIEKLQRSIEAYGFVNPILAQRGTNMIIAGHQRLKAAEDAGLDKVPVIFLDFDDTTARAYNIADNRLNEESEWDFTPLADMLQELDNGSFDLELTGFDLDEIEKLMNWTPEDVEFKEYDESCADDVKKVVCPECGHEFPV